MCGPVRTHTRGGRHVTRVLWLWSWWHDGVAGCAESLRLVWSSDREGVISLAISLSVVVLLAVVLVVMIRGGSLKWGPAVVAALFGFFLASTGVAPDIRRFLNSVAETINGISI